MHFLVPLFERVMAGGYGCTTLGLGPLTRAHEGANAHRVQRKLVEALQEAFAKYPAAELSRVQMATGIRLERVRLELQVGGADRRKVSGVFPVVLEPRWASDEAQVMLAYHPERQDEAVAMDMEAPLEGQLRALFQHAWGGLGEEEVGALMSRGKERVSAVGFTCSPRSALDDLPRNLREDPGQDPAWRHKRKRSLEVLPGVGVNLTARAASGSLDVGVPRAPLREQLAHLLGAARPQPVLVVGAPGSGKSTLIQRAVLDLLEADGYFTHRNLDRVRGVWQVAGRRLLAGMSHLGEWEKRCVGLLEDAIGRNLVLVVDDVHHFARLGQSRESTRSLAEFFRGPLARRELTIVGECTLEGLRLLEQEAPSFAALFTQLHVPEATRAESLQLMLREARALEQRRPVRVTPHALRAILDVGGALISSRALPGKAMDLLRDLEAAQVEGEDKGEGEAKRAEVGTAQVMRLLSAKTGVPESLIDQSAALSLEGVEAQLAAQVIGQPEAVRVAVDLLARVKAGMTDPRRPYGVYLFTGPTGTGKTEMAKALATLLYGSASRLLRFDMSELSGPDAPARLIGDRWEPDGLLTRRAQEQPFSLILLDEIEKAHRSVHALLLQLFEDGRLTDAAGRTARFNHAVIVMTSNLGARTRGALGFGEGGSATRSAAAAEARMKEVAAAVREFFAPELFNRIDRVVPFRPLSAEVAVAVADKELKKLLRRRGLSERNIFASATAGVPEKLSEVAFSAEDGARSVKRAIEDRIGGLLSEAIAGASAAAMQLLRVKTRGEGFALDRQVLEEAPPAAARWAIEPLLKAPLGVLAGALGALSGRMEALVQGKALGWLSARIQHHLGAHRQGLEERAQGERAQEGGGDDGGAEAHALAAVEHAEAVFNLDAMRAAVTAFHGQVERYRRRIEGDVEAEHMTLEARRFGYLAREDEDSRSRVRLFHTSQLEPLERAPTRHEVLEALAEGYALERALVKVDEPGQHAILIELVPAGERERRSPGTGPGLLEALVYAYVKARGEVEGWAAYTERGDLVASPNVAELPRPEEYFAWRLEVVVVGVVGLCVRDFFELESGTHVWTSLGRGPELVRVRVWAAGAGETPRSAVEAHLARRAVFDEAARVGGELPEDPRALGPVVRSIRFDPPEQKGRTAAIDIEDYAMGYAETAEVQSIQQGLEPLWLLRRTREEVG
ncbi:AAA family ATPase [Chondromyces apiculatus]|uniref:ATP-dependent Clp protease ATP-binding subunit ClpA n=1 Tax=Chondromyces apiculatus DSM 436 TaxID=1192034 RepID=A0A017TDZ0_9BACT|nr:AAA family ATPase [Chondromyces apiculatus]EYF07117.1 ATP-dependent Clp protease ATP-binding subunit ClpA [Chondromyces apiculatus DSM 436]